MKKCCICGKEFDGWGNDPWPIKDDGCCCDECNRQYVIPARIAQYYEDYNSKKKED